MSFLDRIAECNNADLAPFRAFRIGVEQVGWIHTNFLPVLRGSPDVFVVNDHEVSLAPSLDTMEKRNQGVATVLQQLKQEGRFRRKFGELYPVHPIGGGSMLMAMERAAVSHFGVRAQGVHMNGFVRKHDGIHMWIARRAANKSTYPGKLDNTVAGGQPIHLSYKENLIKECEEEASIRIEMAMRAISVGAISYVYEEKKEGRLKPNTLFCYDLEMPEDFVPNSTDGEIEKFMLWPIEHVAAIVRDTDDFKLNCNLCIIDFLVRHGLIEAEHPDYLAICQGLRR